MKTRVLDSWPVLEWINGRQPATDMVAELFAESEAGTARLFMSAINVGEVYLFPLQELQQIAGGILKSGIANAPAHDRGAYGW